ncbi:MAG TPA: tetratricopeptide repeat protein [Mucilaginibacter sp.]|jgi:lysophospholipase L1-like esterase
MSKKTTNPTSTGPSKKRIILFKGVSIILIPLLILFLIELLLRILNYGNNYSLFIEYKADKDYLVFNPEASKKYFTDQQIATKGNSEVFKKKKDSNTVRIFVLGESTTIGYPYFHNGSFHRWLQYRLIHTYPDKNFEIINLSLTAVNSYTVLGFAKEVINYQPDAVLIYTGHNEYYGALGAASTQSLGSNPRAINFILSLRNLKLAQLIINISEGLKNSFGKTDLKPAGDRMQQMVAKQEIPYRSDLYQKGVIQFRDNMDEIMRLFTAKHIPLFVSNLVSNEKDLKPFISFEADSIKTPGFKANFALGLKALLHNDTNAAGVYFNRAAQLYNSSALCNYYLGQICYKQGDFSSAKKYFTRAKDLDGLRFRAPEQFNEVLAQLCSKYPTAHLVDTKAAFEEMADHQIIGQGLTVDHVHPDLKGYAIMSDAFYKYLKKYRVVPDVNGNELTFKQLLQDMPENPVDSLAGIYRILNLKKRWPYNDQHAADSVKIESKEEQLAYKLVFENIRWAGIMNNLYQFYLSDHELLKARNVLENLSLEYPSDAGLYERIAMLSGQLKDNEDIVFNFKKSFNLASSFDKARYLFVNYLQMDQPENAVPYINYAMSNNTAGFNLTQTKISTVLLIHWKKMYLQDTTNTSVLLQVASLYSQLRSKSTALKYAEKALKVDPENKEASALLRQINSASNK